MDALIPHTANRFPRLQQFAHETVLIPILSLHLHSTVVAPEGSKLPPGSLHLIITSTSEAL